MMTRSQTDGRILHKLMRSMACLLLIVAVMLPASALAQTKSKKSADSEKILGKIASVEKKGKTAKLSITKDDGGDTLEISILPKTVFAVVAPGDTSFLMKSLYVSGKALKNNDKLLLDALTVYVGIKPELKFAQDPDSQSECDLCGLITDVGQDALTVDVGGTVGLVQVVVPATAKVTVNSGDAALASEGNPVVLEGATRLGKFLPSKVTITLDKPLKVEDVLGNDKSKTASKTKTSTAKTTAKSKTTKTKDDAATEGDAQAPAADPFGLIKKKDTKSKAKTSDKPADKSEAKDADKKEGDKASDKKPATSSKDAAKPATTTDSKP